MRARILFGMFIGMWTAVGSVATDAHAFGRSAPHPDPMPPPSPSPVGDPSPLPSATLFQLGQVVIGGRGCPSAATAISVSPDGRTITLTTSALLANLMTDASIARVECSVAVPVSGLAAGTRLLVTEASATGSYSLAAATTGQASLEVFLAGQTSTPTVLTEGSADSSTAGPLAIQIENAAAGDCGADAIVRISANVNATQSPPASVASTLGFDTLQLELDAGPCDQQPTQ